MSPAKGGIPIYQSSCCCSPTEFAAASHASTPVAASVALLVEVSPPGFRSLTAASPHPIGIAVNRAPITPITMNSTIAAMTTTAVYAAALSVGAFISTGRPR